MCCQATAGGDACVGVRALSGAMASGEWRKLGGGIIKCDVCLAIPRESLRRNQHELLLFVFTFCEAYPTIVCRNSQQDDITQAKVNDEVLKIFGSRLASLCIYCGMRWDALSLSL